MKIAFLFFCTLLAARSLSAQDCTPAQYQKMLKEADQAVKRGEYDLAINKLQSAKVCQPGKAAEVDGKIVAVFEKVNGERELAVKNAEEAKQQRDSARAEARRNYANDLAYKSQSALREGDRTTAFRLAEFAHRYVEKENLNVLRALVEVFHFNDNPARQSLPCYSNFEGHAADVRCVVFSPDGKKIATGAGDNTARIWDAQSGKTILTLTGHTSAVNSIAFSPDGKMLATGSADQTAKIWDLESGKATQTFEGHSAVVWEVAISPDGKMLATSSEDNTTNIWDITSGEIIQTLKGHSSGIESHAFSPDGKKFATVSSDHTAKIWDLQSGKALLTLQGHWSYGNCVAFSPDGKKLATGFDDQSAKIWDIESGQPVLTLTGHSAYINSVAFSPDGKTFATGSDDKTAKIWDLESGKVLLTLPVYWSDIGSVTFSPDGKKLAGVSGLWGYDYDNTVKIWDLDYEKNALTLEGHSSDIESVVFSSDGKKIATGSGDKTARIWDAASGATILTLEGHTSQIKSVDFSPDGKRLATGAWDQTARIWDAETGKSLLTIAAGSEYINAVAFSPDGKNLATGGYDKRVSIWDSETGKPVLQLSGHSDRIESLSFSPDGKWLATGSRDKTAKIWDLKTGKTVQTLEGHLYNVLSVDFSPDGKYLATGSADKMTKIWDLNTGKVILTIDNYELTPVSVTFSPDGKKLATGFTNETATVWDLESGKAIVTLKGHSYDVNSVAFSPDGKRLATGSGDKTVKIWTLDEESIINRMFSGRRLATLVLPQLDIYGLQRLLDIAPDNESGLIATGEAFQIADFADLTAGQATGSDLLRKVEPSYARAARLYAAALQLQDEPGIRRKYLALLDRRVEIYRDAGQAKKAQELEAQAFRVRLSSSSAWELLEYADSFYNQEKWQEAAQFFEKAEQSEHTPHSVFQLYTIAEKTNQPFDFQRILNSEKVEELAEYASYFTEYAQTKDRSQCVPEYQKAALIYEKILLKIQSRGQATDFVLQTISGCYSNLGYYQLFIPDAKAAETSIRRAIELDPGNKFAYANLAPALLLQGRIEEAKAEYQKWAARDFGEQNLPAYRDAFLEDLNALEEANIPLPAGFDYSTVKEWLH